MEMDEVDGENTRKQILNKSETIEWRIVVENKEIRVLFL